MVALFVADIGGTKSRLGLVQLQSGRDDFVVQAVYKNAEFSCFEDIVAEFIEEYDVAADFACLAVAGVVENNSVRMTNLSWLIDGNALSHRFSWSKVFLVNDMTALAMSIPQLGGDDIIELKSGIAQADETIAVIAPGTGLGQGYLVPHGDTFLYKCSEGGHSGFSPSNEEELQLSSWLINKRGYACAEQVCSGPAIASLYTYYLEKNDIEPLAEVAEKVERAVDPTPVVVAAAVADDPCPLCTKVIDTYLSALGGEAANQALKLYALGGVYIGGGVIRHLIGRVSFQPFLETFKKEGKMADLLASIPVYIIRKDDTLMYGALHHARCQVKF